MPRSKSAIPAITKPHLNARRVVHLPPELTYAAQVSYEHRKRRGQFFTPPDVAQAMARWVCENRPSTLLDPAVGPGAFLECVARQRVPVQRVVAYDVDAA